MLKKISFFGLSALLISSIFVSCSKDKNMTTPATGKDITMAPKVSVDRFSAAAGHILVRNATNGLPAANAPINLDNQPFITTGLDKNGNSVMYYNFDVQSTKPSPIYVFFKNGATMPISGQNNVVATIPGDSTYNDFWLITKVTVPDNYVPNTLTSEAAILSSGYTITPTTSIVNCPIVPFGSTANRSFSPNTPSTLTLGWYKDQAVTYFNFGEASLMTTANGMVPTSPIYVMFQNNMDPSMGFRTVTGTLQTHNVISTSPGDAGYSPLWSVNKVDSSNFNTVINLATALAAGSTPLGANVNCPVVK